MNPITFEQFIERATEKFGNKFDYSKARDDYEDYYTSMVTIICPIHGEFKIRPKTHIKSRTGCPLCSKNRKTTEMYIEEAKKVFGDLYDYSKTVYKSVHEKVTIICPIHGEFVKEAKEHLSGAGCPKCALDKKHRSFALTTEEFIRRSREVHGDLYDYSKVNYINQRTPVLIGCPKHGWFEQIADNHLHGEGCPYCRGEKIGDAKRKTLEQFISEAREIHGDYYDYSKVVYERSDEPVTIICPVHGEFKQSPSSHLSGHGCPSCNRISKGEERIFLILKEYGVSFKKQFKIVNESDISANKRFFVDFYLEDYNLVIEYNGVQHYNASERFGGESRFIEQKNRDEGLRQTLKKRGIQLLEIPYTEYKNIKQIIIERLHL